MHFASHMNACLRGSLTSCCIFLYSNTRHLSPNVVVKCFCSYFHILSSICSFWHLGQIPTEQRHQFPSSDMFLVRETNKRASVNIPLWKKTPKFLVEIQVGASFEERPLVSFQCRKTNLFFPLSATVAVQLSFYFMKYSYLFYKSPDFDTLGQLLWYTLQMTISRRTFLKCSFSRETYPFNFNIVMYLFRWSSDLVCLFFFLFCFGYLWNLFLHFKSLYGC